MEDNPVEKEVVFESAEETQDDQPKRLGRRRSRNDGSWIIGVILVVLGGVFLLQTQGAFYLHNWWAVFILIPALGSLNEGWKAYQDAGYLNSKARSSFFFGVIMLMVSAIFLFNLSWSLFGPAILILIGISVLLSGFISRDRE